MQSAMLPYLLPGWPQDLGVTYPGPPRMLLADQMTASPMPTYQNFLKVIESQQPQHTIQTILTRDFSSTAFCAASWPRTWEKHLISRSKQFLRFCVQVFPVHKAQENGATHSYFTPRLLRSPWLFLTTKVVCYEYGTKQLISINSPQNSPHAFSLSRKAKAKKETKNIAAFIKIK